MSIHCYLRYVRNTHTHFDVRRSFLLLLMITTTQVTSVKINVRTNRLTFFLDVFMLYNTSTHVDELYCFVSDWPHERKILKTFLRSTCK